MAHHRLYNFIEHVKGTEHRYLFMDVLEGPAQARSNLVPDSPDWFGWLARLGSFHLAFLEQTAHDLHEAALGAIHEDEALNTRAPRPTPDGLQVGPFTVLWHEDVLSVRTPTEHHILSWREAAELLSYLYDQRASLLKQRR